MSTHPPNKRKRDDLEDIFSDSSTPAATPKKRRQRRRRSSNRHHQDARAQASASYSSSASGSADESQGKKGKRRAAGWGHEDGAAKRVSGSPLEPENKSAALAPKAEDVADPEQGLSELERLRHQVKQKDALLQEYDQFARLVQSHVSCHICMEVMTEPLTLVCGHTFCKRCLWECFNRPVPDEDRDSPASEQFATAEEDEEEEEDQDHAPRRTSERPAAANARTEASDILYKNAQRRRNLVCPSCRDRIHERPLPVFGLRDVTHVVHEATRQPTGVLFDGSATAAGAASSGKEALLDLDSTWDGLFPQDKLSRDGESGSRRRRGMHDNEDDVFRCLHCGWEIEDGECQNCGAAYSDTGAGAGADFYINPSSRGHADSPPRMAVYDDGTQDPYDSREDEPDNDEEHDSFIASDDSSSQAEEEDRRAVRRRARVVESDEEDDEEEQELPTDDHYAYLASVAARHAPRTFDSEEEEDGDAGGSGSEEDQEGLAALPPPIGAHSASEDDEEEDDEVRSERSSDAVRSRLVQRSSPAASGSGSGGSSEDPDDGLSDVSDESESEEEPRPKRKGRAVVDETSDDDDEDEEEEEDQKPTAEQLRRIRVERFNLGQEQSDAKDVKPRVKKEESEPSDDEDVKPRAKKEEQDSSDEDVKPPRRGRSQLVAESSLDDAGDIPPHMLRRFRRGAAAMVKQEEVDSAGSDESGNDDRFMEVKDEEEDGVKGEGGDSSSD